MLMALIITVVSIAIAYYSAPGEKTARTAGDLGVDITPAVAAKGPHQGRPSGRVVRAHAYISIIIAVMGFGFIGYEFVTKDPLLAISNLNTYNLMFLLFGLLLHWEARQFPVGGE